MYNLNLDAQYGSSNWVFLNNKIYFVMAAMGGNQLQYTKFPTEVHRVLVLYGFNGAGLSFINLGEFSVSGVAVSSSRVFFIKTVTVSGVQTRAIYQMEVATAQNPAYPAVTTVVPNLVITLTNYKSAGNELIYDTRSNGLEVIARRKGTGVGVILIISLNPVTFTGTISREWAFDTAAAPITYTCAYRTL